MVRKHNKYVYLHNIFKKGVLCRIYLDSVVKDLLPDHVALIGSGDNVQESVRLEKGKKNDSYETDN